MRSTHAAAVLLLLVSTPLAAQAPCYAENDGPAFNDGVSMGGPDLLLAIKFRTNVNDTVLGLQVFTGERTGENSVALWSHDATNDRPLAPLGTGRFEMDPVNGWQGACLDVPVAVTTSQPYWLVWGCVNSSQASVDSLNAVGGQPYRGSFDNGGSWNGPFSSNTRHWKFRLLCAASILPGSWVVSGAGCTGSNGLVPEVGFGNEPLINSTLSAELEHAAPFAPAGLVLGIALPSPIDLTGFGAPGCQVLCGALASTSTLTDMTGSATIGLPIPNDPALRCATICSQWAVVDSGANSLGIVLSASGDATFGG